MDIEDIENWYDEKKEYLTTNYRAKVDKAVKFGISNKKNKHDKKSFNIILDNKKKLKASYLVSMKKLHNDYDTKIKNSLSRGLSIIFLKHRFSMWKKKNLGFIIDYFKDIKKKKKE